MISLTLQTVADILSTQTNSPSVRFLGISTDTRTLQPGNLFFALSGPNFDAHLFLQEAKAKGAIAAIVTHKMEVDLPQLIVKDIIEALGKLAHHWRQQFSLPLIAVTGSNGKTSTKSMIASILKNAHSDENVLAAQGTQNNHIGVPLTLAKLNEKHRAGVIEMGMNHFGEIDYLSKMALPHIAIITNAGPSHLEGVGDLQGVARAKAEIFVGLDDDGIGIINADDSFASYWQSTLSPKRFVYFGIKNTADYQASDVQEKHLDSGLTIGHEFILSAPQGKITITLPLPGKHNVINALAAAAACLELGLGLEAVKEGLSNLQAVNGRVQLQQAKNGALIINDTYNASLESLQAGINILATHAARKILVLGDMRELGEMSQAHHTAAGKIAKQANINLLFCLGELSKNTATSFGTNATHFDSVEDLLKMLENTLQETDAVLIKGSRGMKMERIVEALMR